ncbi:hypothetical protein K2Z84_03040 [Candidatus Binatia bacterium]|jgi:hypothetical protein|nr:hypothetical protein [Candidatus Binatia bacterium]
MLRALPVVVFVTVLGFSNGVDAQTSVTPDGHFAMVQKQVGSERWTIVRDQSDMSITGNVLDDRGRSSFVWCSWLGEESYDCSGNSYCFAGGEEDCPWTFIATVELPESFFGLPIGGGIGTGDPAPSSPTPTPHACRPDEPSPSSTDSVQTK